MRGTCFDDTVDIRFFSSSSHFWKWCTLRFPSWVNCFSQLSRRQIKGFVCWWTVLWAHMFPFWANRLWQISQEKGFSPVWRRWWVWAWSGMLHTSRRRLRTFRLPSCEKRRPHKGFSQIYDGQHICLFRVQNKWSLTNGLSPVCVLIWVSKCALCAKFFPQCGSVHAYFRFFLNLDPGSSPTIMLFKRKDVAAREVVGTTGALDAVGITES